MTIERPDTPQWTRDAIFYQIFPDRFARSRSAPTFHNLEEWSAPPTYNGYKGGDLGGVAEHLDYIQDLGVNAVYFTPVFQSASNHRYHTHDYEKVDPMLGGDAALRRLIDEAHRRNIKVVLDGVFNHASRGFFQFHDNYNAYAEIISYNKLIQDSRKRNQAFFDQLLLPPYSPR